MAKTLTKVILTEMPYASGSLTFRQAFIKAIWLTINENTLKEPVN